LKSAVKRGASHYDRAFSSDIPEDFPDLTDEEIGVALCLGIHPYNPVFIRAAAQLLSSPDVNPRRLLRLAKMERVEPILLHIAEIAGQREPRAQPWEYLRQNLARRAVPTESSLPHWSRFVSQTNVTPFGGGPEIKWLYRRRLAA